MTKTLMLCAAAVAALSTAALAAPALAASADIAQAQHLGTWGFDLTGRSTSVKPGDDFYRYADGAWSDRTQIPGDRSRFGSFDKLRDLSDNRVHEVVEKAAANKAATGEEAKIGAFYAAFMDEKRVEALDAKPLAGDLDAIRKAKSREEISSLMGRSPKSYLGSLFSLGISDDAKDPQHYAIYVGQAGLGLPDRDYYLKPDFAEKKAKYQAYVATQLKAVNWPDAEARAADIVALETKIADASWTRAEQRDDVKMYNATTVNELAAAAPGFGWKAFFASADLGSADRIVVQENTAFPKLAAIFADTPIEVLQAWLAFDVVDSASPVLSKRFVDAEFDFRNKTLSGQLEIKPRWKRAVSAVGNNMGEAVGKVYVATYFPPEDKAKMQALVGNLKVALQARLEKVTWMTDATKAQALDKLSKFGVKIAYTDKWRDYSGLEISQADLYGDVQRSAAFEWAYRVGRLGGPVDKTEWEMFPQTVNAYYTQTKNEIVFPAAILQPPFFDPKADMAVNYGGIGAVIGHEMTHGFDDEGRMSDGNGVLRDWWTAEDAAKFEKQADRLGAQYSAFEPLPGAHIDGKLTMGENIADLGGLLVALDAYHASLNGKPAPIIDGLTGDQRVFLGWAQVWRAKHRDDGLRQQLVSDPHSPEVYRVNGVVRNIDAWYQAFGVKPGDALYVPPEQRVRLW